ncbi:MAG: glycosyltransferase, partial [Saprospiraceae bacterium]
TYTFQSAGKRLFHRWIGRYLLQQCLLHGTSEIETRQVRHVAPGCRSFQAPNIVSFPDITTEEPAGSPFLHLCFVGRLHPVKGLLPLFQALSSVSFPWQMTIAGTGEGQYAAHLQARAQELDLNTHIRWIGWVEGAEKYRLLAVSDLFVLTSYSENFANAALEALAMGTPVLLSAEVGLAAYVQQTGAGSVCAPDSGAIGAALEDLNRLIQCGRFDRTAIARQTRADFDSDRIAEQYLDAYQTLT